MLINYVPGEECRVAIVEDEKLEELHVERFAQASRVGNIYAGVVVNVEPSIQAAFIDFGVGENGFLHVTDLHPRYFPGEDDETTERVGFKTPRRERPPIQAALRRGDEVIVQVLKEGVGTKGPAVTSYLSIPGRFLVMMPGMDKVGVSRKVEDEEQRRAMREILDQLELPDGFGFILRTAGMDRTKAELKRDLAYLQRLWKDMEKREKAGPRGKPRLLYSESDLLVRALRDLLTAEISEVVVDHETALRRAGRFMKIVAPRGTTKLLHAPGPTPLFHAFGIEHQISLIHAREVPLPSGGRLVIDQTEALVAIDVNSGKSRESRNSEDNAYQTNLEAVDEICRQLRLRDMGGIVINDLIDMRESRHRKDVENRFKERLKRDRAKSTITGISEFGILEMTRQRMRPSHESVHFTDCPTCRGRGMLQRPDSVASDALRELSAVLDVQRVHKVEMVVAPRVAGELLSTKRALLGRIERAHGKHVDVRVSEATSVDRVTFYAYDPVGADIDLGNLPKPKKPRDLREWEDPSPAGDWTLTEEEAAPSLDAEVDTEADAEVEHPIEFDVPDDGGASVSDPALGEGGGRRRRRRRGRGRGGAGGGGGGEGVEARPVARPRTEDAGEPGGTPGDEQGQSGPGPARQGVNGMGPAGPGEQRPAGEGEGGGRRRRRRRGRGRGRGGAGEGGEAPIGDGRSVAGGRPAPVGRAPAGARGDRDQKPARRDVSVATGGEWGDDGEPLAPAKVRGDQASDDREPVEGAMLNGETPVARAPGEGAPDVPVARETVDAEDGDDADGPEHDEQVAGEPGASEGAPAGEGEGEGGGRRRRRRRRRGRGGRGGSGGEGGEGRAPGEGRPQVQSKPPTEGRQPTVGRPQGDGGRGQRPAKAPSPPVNAEREVKPPPVPRPASQRPVSPAAPDPAAKPAPPKVRTLYGAVRRKLTPAELNKRPKPE